LERVEEAPEGYRCSVPKISTFYGIVVAMYFDEQGVPHFHARYAGDQASIAIATLEVLAGSLPDRALRLVLDWASLHHDELEENWTRARNELPLEPIPPLP
jgi:hypothetical protein